jgi:hypothetical protein
MLYVLYGTLFSLEFCVCSGCAIGAQKFLVDVCFSGSEDAFAFLGLFSFEEFLLLRLKDL